MPWTISLAIAAAAFAAGPPCAPGDSAPPTDVAARADGALTLRLNLPAFRVDLRDGSGLVRSYTVAIGSRRYRTPTGRYHVSSVELNPWWHPPDSEWARKERVTPPGPNNPMGRAKLNFHELYFLHGTPLEESLGSAASHGCVRMASADALDLARRVLAFARPDVRPEEIDAAEASRRTRYYALRATVPLEIVYRTVEVRDGALELHPDVYRRESTTLRARALEALLRAGVAEEMIDPVRLDSVARVGRRRHVRVEVDALFRAPEPPPAVSMDTVVGAMVAPRLPDRERPTVDGSYDAIRGSSARASPRRFPGARVPRGGAPPTGASLRRGRVRVFAPRVMPGPVPVRGEPPGGRPHDPLKDRRIRCHDRRRPTASAGRCRCPSRRRCGARARSWRRKGSACSPRSTWPRR